MDPRLISAAQIGSIDDLYALIHGDPYILETIDVIPFISTPLHRTIKGLFKLDPDLVRLQGKEGTAPFRMLVRRGELDLMTEFLLPCLRCVKDVNVNGKTPLHKLEVLVGWVQKLRQIDAELLEMQVLNRCDQNGNIALHMAAYQDKIKAIKILLGSRAVNRNIYNQNGLTALAILQNQRYRNGRRNHSKIRRSPIRFKEHLYTKAARYKKKISDGSRSALLVIVALIITTTYQTALQPPGGVYQSNAEESSDRKSVAGEEYMWYFLWIMVPLHVSYLVSVSVISPDTIWYLPFSIGWVIFVIIVYMIVCFLRWKWSKKKIPEPRSELVLAGLTTLNQAKEVGGLKYNYHSKSIFTSVRFGLYTVGFRFIRFYTKNHNYFV
ncbi:hypothetical protein BRARA_I02276 [Brassica rapa]|uniref:PGG domain-containing protein n=1 Tax=Brassica campestris TaxID=3711 RepID=A0A397XW08_BRACM|nr:hypothetical protein BRARA_I02276 [Brassica rapa]